MKSWKIARIRGITLELHWTTILFIIFLIVLNPVYSIVFLILFFVISLHELSHAIVAGNYGIVVDKIVLLPIGGMAVMEESKLQPKTEFYMAIAGPLFNFLFAFVLLIVVQGLGLPIYDLTTWNNMIEGKLALDLVGFTTSTLFWVNWLLGSFNLFVPAIPMDGGRVYRAILAMMMDYITATKIAAYTSKIVTFIMFVIAIFTFNIILLLISVFIYLGASAEVEQAININVLSRMDTRSLIRKSAPKLRSGASVLNAVERMSRVNQTQVFVTNYLAVTLEDINRVPRDMWETTPIARIARPVKPVRVGERADIILKLFLGQDVDILPVKSGRRIVGYIYRDDLERAIRLARGILNL